MVIAPRAISVRTECQGTTCLDLGRTPRPTKGWSGSVKLRYWRPEKFLRVRPAERLNWPEEREDTPSQVSRAVLNGTLPEADNQIGVSAAEQRAGGMWKRRKIPSLSQNGDKPRIGA